MAYIYKSISTDFPSTALCKASYSITLPRLTCFWMQWCLFSNPWAVLDCWLVHISPNFLLTPKVQERACLCRLPCQNRGTVMVNDCLLLRSRQADSKIGKTACQREPVGRCSLWTKDSRETDFVQRSYLLYSFSLEGRYRPLIRTGLIKQH